MRQSLVPVILLATVALSSSNVLPVMSSNQLETEPLGLNSRHNDNIFSNRLRNRNIFNDIFYKISIGTPLNDQFAKVRKLPEIKFADLDNNYAEDDFHIINKDESYNGEGFRKEQWHNYPRQLDRLHKYLYEQHNADKRNLDPDNPDDPEDYTEGTVAKNVNKVNDLTTNELLVYINDDEQNIFDTIIANTNPFLILKVRLAYLDNKLSNKDSTNVLNLASYESEPNHNEKDDEKLFTNEIINPSMDAVKVKREDLNRSENSGISEHTVDGKVAVKKRLFSFWSRLQGLNHKGHELQHRRHLHAFYGLPDGGDGNGILTAETRAQLRPPGSPLRWG